MHKVTATWSIGLIAATTLALTFIQPTIIHQLVIWVGGTFAILVALALFVVGNWPHPQQEPRKPNADEYTIAVVKELRTLNGWEDAFIAKHTGIDIDVIKAIPR